MYKRQAQHHGQGIQAIETRDHDEQWLPHVGMHRGCTTELDARRLVQAEPPVNGLVDDRNVDRTHQAQHGTGLGLSLIHISEPTRPY